MRILGIKISNYKSFRDSGMIELHSGMNLIVGKNNSGKTALLEALSLPTFREHPYRGIGHVKGQPVDPKSELRLVVEVNGIQLLRHLLSSDGDYWIPTPKAVPADSSIDWFTKYLNSNDVRFELVRREGNWNTAIIPCISGLGPAPQSARIKVTPDRSGFVSLGHMLNYSNDTLWNNALTLIQNSIYVFRAERPQLGRANHANTIKLQTNASDLAAAINTLQGRNPSRFALLNKLMLEVFPTIYGITAVPSVTQSSMVELRVWSAPQSEENEDLAFDLSDCGTGVGQALAILYVVVTSDFPSTIAIDEPSSFLHPAAAKTLMNILRSYPQHQYIISTHSTEIIGSSRLSTLNLIRWTSNGSIVTKMDVDAVSDTTLALREVGAALSDVFGSDSILWVEGPTEACCFPKILQSFEVELPLGMSILAVRSTSIVDQKGQIAKTIWDIYRRISNGSALVPPVVAISLDREDTPDGLIKELKKISGGLIKIMPRRTYENYLLDCEAISALLNETLGTVHHDPAEPAKIAAWINEHGSNRRYFGDVAVVPIQSPDWKRFVNGAKLLADLVSELSETKITYDKTDHSVFLTKWVLANKKTEFCELVDYLKDVIVEGVRDHVT